MRIKKVERYVVNGSAYTTAEKAVEAVEEQLLGFVKEMCSDPTTALGAVNWIPITQYIVVNKARLLPILECLVEGVVEE
jgi:hypothetical protein